MLRSVVLVSAALLVTTLPARGARVFLNDPVVTLDQTNPLYPSGVIGPTVFSAKYRLSVGNFDQSLSPYGGTGTAGTTWLANNMGTVAQLSGVAWDFSLMNTPGTGLVFSLSRIVAGTLVRHETEWGAFSAAPGRVVSATLNPGGGAAGPLDRSYNAIRMTVRGSEASPFASSAAMSNLVFTSPTLAAGPGGTLQSRTAAPSTGASTPQLSFPADGAGFLSQWIVADTNLAGHTWTLSGVIRLARGGGGDGEAVRFTIDGTTVLGLFPAETPPPSQVPEASTLLLAGCGLLWIGAAGTRRAKVGREVHLRKSGSSD